MLQSFLRVSSLQIHITLSVCTVCFIAYTEGLSWLAQSKHANLNFTRYMIHTHFVFEFLFIKTAPEFIALTPALSVAVVPP